MDAPKKFSNSNVALGRIVMNAVRKLQGKDGIALRDLKKHLKDFKKMDIIANDAGIKFNLKKALDRGILTRDGGNYKVIETKRRRSRKSSKGRKTSRMRRKRSSGRKRSRSGRKRSSKRRSSGKRRSRRRRRKSPVEVEM